MLHHGRGTDERDLLGLADVARPASGGCRSSRRGRRCSCPARPATTGTWCRGSAIPDRETFHAARAALAELHDGLWEETGIGPERTVLGGFSMGAVMSYAMGLGADRPAVAGILAFSGFVPTVEGWRAEPRGSRAAPRSSSAHGRNDPVIEIELRRTRPRAARGGRPRGHLPRVGRSATRSTRPTSPPRPSGCLGSRD